MDNDLISRSALLEFVEFDRRMIAPDEHTATDIIAMIKTAPAVNAVHVVYAKWKLNKSGSGTCSNCKKTQNNVWDYDGWQSYCGCCGAKMTGLLAM